MCFLQEKRTIHTRIFSSSKEKSFGFLLHFLIGSFYKKEDINIYLEEMETKKTKKKKRKDERCEYI